MGHGSGTTGGGSVTPMPVQNITELRNAVARAEPRVIVGPAGWLDNGGDKLDIDKPNCTLRGVNLKRAQLQLRASNVLIEDCRGWPGDQVNAPNDADGLSILGPSSGYLQKIAILRSSFAFAPDVVLTVLRDVRDWTIQECMIFGGLYRSAHYEADDAGEDHSYAMNIASWGVNPASQPYGRRGTIWRTLIAHSDGRMPNTWEFDKLDVINNVLYNAGRNGWVGNPRHMNGVNNIIRSGPQSTANSRRIWRGTQHEGGAWFPASVYLAGNVADGFTGSISYGPGTKRTTPYLSLSVAPVAPNLEWVLGVVGPTVRNSVELAMLNHVRNRTSPGFYNGQGFSAPNPSWP